MADRRARAARFEALPGGQAGAQPAPPDTAAARVDLDGQTPDLLVDALAVGESWTAAAAIAGISRSTLARRMRSPAFRYEVQVRRMELTDRVIGLLVGSGELAAFTLRQLAVQARSEQVRLGAASRLLDHLRLPTVWEPGIGNQDDGEVGAWLASLTVRDEEAS